MPKLTKLPALSAQAAAGHRAALLIVACRYALQNDGVPIAASQQWHTQRQVDFLAWLDQGGFMQTARTKENSGIAPLSSTPAGAV
ncbi:hypothetical protein ACFFKC_00940 [Pseudoduganella danionis]|uniref:Uncharacterized protein n=1 Tax=Pseudoduganella danionis TaxID=1890295 RepID=A0ABW9SL13_9BURK|nr:hypothetical protein [Pseudoduganella danionis]MTW31918.1 hypothetical protein [Pseudoduganella danionis]